LRGCRVRPAARPLYNIWDYLGQRDKPRAKVPSESNAEVAPINVVSYRKLRKSSFCDGRSHYLLKHCLASGGRTRIVFISASRIYPMYEYQRHSLPPRSLGPLEHIVPQVVRVNNKLLGLTIR